MMILHQAHTNGGNMQQPLFFGLLCGCGINNNGGYDMKKIIVLIVALVFVACDPLFHDDFIIVNNCNDDINVSVIYRKGDKQSFIINPHSECTFFYDEWIGGGVSKVEKIDYIFKEIVITKDSTVSIINYVDYRLWRKENLESSRRNAYYTKVRYYLTVNPEDFE
jgi:hypothetical protein